MLYKSLSQQQHKKEKKITMFLSYIYVELALEEVVCFDAEKKLILI